MKYHEINPKDNMKVLNPDVEEIAETGVAAKEEVQAVIAGPMQKKPGLFKRLFKGLAGPDAGREISHYIVHEIIGPSIQDIVYSSFISGVNMMFGRQGTGYVAAPKNQTGQPYKGPEVNYAAGSKISVPPRPQNEQFAPEIPIPTQQEAALVLKTLKDRAEAHGKVSLADYYRMVRLESSWADNSYGWSAERLRGVPISGYPSRGWIIQLPELELL